jgi:hypothetical protein
MDLVLLVIGLCGGVLAAVFTSVYVLNRIAERNDRRAELAGSNNRGAAL